jgi:probable rRNA maturation factor
MILNRQRSVRVARRPLELFLRRTREALGLGEAGLTICFVSDAEIARMNETFRHKKGPTDVLSFPYRERGADKLRHTRGSSSGRRHTHPRAAQNATDYLGDIAISPVTARRNAKRLGRNLGSELRILMLHGVLHLLGFDHERDQGQMNRLERRLRRRLGLA